MGNYPLQDGEQVLWTGAPRRRQRWFYEHYAILFGFLLLAGFFVVGAALDPSFGQYVFLFPVLAVMGLSMWTMRLRENRARALATTYLVTDRRIVFVAQWPTGAEFRWVWHHQLRPPRVKADHTGVGTISFGESPWTRWKLAAAPQLGAWVPFAPRLHAIADAPRVAEVIRLARTGLSLSH